MLEISGSSAAWQPFFFRWSTRDAPGSVSVLVLVLVDYGTRPAVWERPTTHATKISQSQRIGHCDTAQRSVGLTPRCLRARSTGSCGRSSLGSNQGEIRRFFTSHDQIWSLWKTLACPADASLDFIAMSAPFPKNDAAAACIWSAPCGGAIGRGLTSTAGELNDLGSENQRHCPVVRLSLHAC